MVLYVMQTLAQYNWFYCAIQWIAADSIDCNQIDGYDKDWTQHRKKHFKNMKTSFNKLKDNNITSGSSVKKLWKF